MSAGRSASPACSTVSAPGARCGRSGKNLGTRRIPQSFGSPRQRGNGAGGAAEARGWPYTRVSICPTSCQGFAGHGSAVKACSLSEVQELSASATVGLRTHAPRPGGPMQASAMSERPDTLAPLPPILVVDDSRTNRQLLRELLEPAGYKVLEAADEDSALKLAHSKRPGCVLLDIRMPGLDGFGVLERLKQDPVTREIPVFVLTATANQVGDVRRALEGGATGYLLKPLDLPDTRARIHAAIERYRSALET